ncbi:hypothetical protein [Xanthomonas phaseoli]|uniref:hypothetical protein n=1 Tax=Xanthomonas phaseoli TaxID=1985254 RepID=UPI00031A14F1|nr:hypothetical protein [Xanthomonas phaseoli]RWU16210.1 hypothetical protein XANMN_12815 [Xanthomonas phaseoli pv. manihotis str. CIO151]UEQ13681.1 hypothetical protein K9838_13175 [Xanthomonas phaseoli pv. manihotis]
MADFVSWNSGFNEAAKACGLNADDLLAIPDMSDAQIAGAYWSRRGSKIHVGFENSFWTVDTKDIETIAAQTYDLRIAEFEACAEQAQILFVDLLCEDDQQAKPAGEVQP